MIIVIKVIKVENCFKLLPFNSALKRKKTGTHLNYYLRKMKFTLHIVRSDATLHESTISSSRATYKCDYPSNLIVHKVDLIMHFYMFV